MELANNPLTEREQRIIKANSVIGDTCPNPDCEKTPQAAEVDDNEYLYVVHEEDGVGLEGTRKVGPRGCRIDPSNDPTL